MTAPSMSPPVGVRLWVAGARPRTLPAAVVPVLLGGAVSAVFGPVSAWRFLAALVVSLALQVGVNFANDYSDGVRGTDVARVGPLRLVGSGLVGASRVKQAAFASFAVAAIAGLTLALATTLWLVVVGLAAIAAGWFYTGGPRPYGYAGFGEVFVFVFFGLVAVVGTVYVQLERIPAVAWWVGSAAGLLSVALIVVNNLRDIPGDTTAGKRTLAVRLGDTRTRMLYVAALAGSFALLLVQAATLRHVGPLLGFASVIAAVPPVRTIRSGARGRDLIAVLGGTGRVQLAYGLLTSLGFLLAK